MFRQKDTHRFGLSRRTYLWVAIGLIAISAALAGFAHAYSGVDGSTYQLVRLDNGESYVGHLSGLHDQYAMVDDPFVYKDPSSGNGAASTNSSEIQLLRVSSVDGPLRIDTGKIVYWGNLPKEGKVVNAIKSAGKQ